jgi:phosphocarrier protein
LADPLTATVILKNIRGLHARASAKFAAVAGSFDADVRVARGEWRVSGVSIMALMTLGAGFGEEITIETSGRQAADALDTLVKLIEDRFGEKK